MTVGKLIELLQDLSKDDLIQIKAWTKGNDGHFDSELLKIDSVDDDTNVGVWNLICSEYEDGESVWDD